jgi:hypothetical protein
MLSNCETEPAVSGTDAEGSPSTGLGSSADVSMIAIEPKDVPGAGAGISGRSSRSSSSAIDAAGMSGATECSTMAAGTETGIGTDEPAPPLGPDAGVNGTVGVGIGIDAGVDKETEDVTGFCAEPDTGIGTE